MPLDHSYISFLVFEENYHYSGHLRWSYLWASSNYAGAFLAAFEPAIWMAAGLLYNKWRGRITGWLQLAAELVFWFLVAHTYSRNAIVAAFCARAAWQAMHGELTAIKSWGRYLLAPLVCILLTGSGGRIYNTIAAMDPSAEQRLEIWIAAPRMLAASPWTGWGAGKSGMSYVNWYEKLDHPEILVVMPNAYLNLAVEWGLPVFCLIIFVYTCVTYGGMSAAKSAAKSGRPSLPLAAAASSCVAWAVSNFFSSMYAVPSLWIVPGVAACVIAGHRDTWRSLKGRKILQCASFALGLGLALFSAGVALEWRRPILAHRDGNDTVTLESRMQSPENKGRPAIDIWSDPLVLGNHPGHALRAWMRQPGGPERLIVHASFKNDLQPAQDSRILVLVGRRASLLQSLPALPTAGIILVHPLQWTREDFSRLRGLKTVIVIPDIDQTGTNDAVKSEAQALGAKVLLSPGAGLDLRAPWSEVMKSAIDSL